MRLEITTEEKQDLFTVEEGSHLEAPESIRQGVVEGEGDVLQVRNMAAQALETGAVERYGLDSMEDLFERTTEMVFGGVEA